MDCFTACQQNQSNYRCRGTRAAHFDDSPNRDELEKDRSQTTPRSAHPLAENFNPPPARSMPAYPSIALHYMIPFTIRLWRRAKDFTSCDPYLRGIDPWS